MLDEQCSLPGIESEICTECIPSENEEDNRLYTMEINELTNELLLRTFFLMLVIEWVSFQ